MTRFVEDGWKAYRRMFVPMNASHRQRDALRQAYFAGAAVLFQTLMASMSEDEEPTREDLARMEALQAELDAFGQELDNRHLRKGGTH